MFSSPPGDSLPALPCVPISYLSNTDVYVVDFVHFELGYICLTVRFVDCLKADSHLSKHSSIGQAGCETAAESTKPGQPVRKQAKPRETDL